MSKVLTGNTLLKKHVSRSDRVLLINPPVIEARYSWLQWNQPLDLLTVGSFIQAEIGAKVELLDFMLPDSAGKVTRQARTGERRYEYVEDAQIPMWRFGRPFDYLDTWVQKKKKVAPRSLPTQVWISSLCAYWFESVAMMVTAVRKALPNAQVIICGQYPELMPAHAADFSAADLIVTKRPDLSDQSSKIDLYGEQLPPFFAITLNAEAAIQTIEMGVARDVVDFAFFAEDICQDRGGPLQEIFERTKNLHKHLRFHVICGLNAKKVTKNIARTLAHTQFRALHFEEESKNGRVQPEPYEKAMRYLAECGLKKDYKRTSGFVWMGRPGEKLDHLMENSFSVLKLCNSLILKPYTPTPGSADHKKYEKYLSRIEYAKWSPHFFPFAAKNAIGIGEYHDMYRVAAFLNEKIRGKSFDFLKESKYGAQFLQESLRREVWNLEGQQIVEEQGTIENPLSIVD